MEEPSRVVRSVKMSKLTIMPVKSLKGVVKAPPSKSHSHRILVVGLLSDENIRISNPLLAGDVYATINGCKLFGAKLKIRRGLLEVTPPSTLTAPSEVLDAQNSATTIRFMMPIASMAKGTTVLRGSRSLNKRPMGDLITALTKLGAKCKYLDKEGYPPISITGNSLFGGETQISGAVSSQFISSLLLSLPKCKVDSTIRVLPPVKSKPYINMTLEILKKSGVHVNATGDLKKFIIPANQHYNIKEYYVPSDYSSMAFILAAAAITNSEITVKNVDFNSVSADKKILSDLGGMGVNMNIDTEGNKLIVKGAKLVGRKIYCGNSPDLIPILTVVASYAKGKTILYGAEHVRYKESDRLFTISKELRKMGAEIRETRTGLTIIGKNKLNAAGDLESYGDHRIFMSLCVAALKAEGPCTINGLDCYRDSYPSFIQDLKKIGVEVKEDI